MATTKPTTPAAKPSTTTKPAAAAPAKAAATKPAAAPAKAPAAAPVAKVAAKPAPAPAAAKPAPAPRAAKAQEIDHSPKAPVEEVEAPAPREPDPRLPPVGTKLTKLGRDGTVRAECTVTAEGIVYEGNVYKSLSGAGMAACAALGLTNKSINGFVFWGLSKPAARAKVVDPLATIDAAWDRYSTRLSTAFGSVNSAEHPEIIKEICEKLNEHANAIVKAVRDFRASQK